MSHKKYYEYRIIVLPPIPLVPSQLQKWFLFGPRAWLSTHYVRSFHVFIIVSICHDYLSYIVTTILTN